MKNKKGNFFSGNTAILIKCLGIAVLFFILTKLSKTYTATVPFKVNYTSFPENRLPAIPLNNEIEITVKTTGFNLLSAMILQNNEIDIPLDNFQNQSLIRTNENLAFINSSLKEGYEAIHIRPDTLPLHFSKKISKTVPVKLIADISFANQYDAVEELLIQPTSVKIIGAEPVVNEISFWPTDTLILNKLKETAEGYIPLKNPDSIQIVTEPNTIKYLLVVEEFTEGVVTVPVKLLNQPKNTEIIIFPKKVELRYQVGLSNYEKSKDEYYEITADFKDVNLSEKKSIDLKLESAPLYIKKYKIHPESVDFIIYK
ncbi:MAG: YbbR-like domain-containing protein [Chitinophagales bacterium]